MADFVHSLPRTQPSSKKSSNSNAFAANVYEDVFGGASKYGIPSFTSRVDDYSEIFSSYNNSSSRGSSIPFLDLPVAVDDEADFGNVQCSEFDYYEIFGGFDSVDYAVPYEELFLETKATSTAAAGVEAESSSEDVWTPAETASPSEESSEDPVCSERNQAFSNTESHYAYDGVKQFNVSYHMTNQTSKEDGISGTTHIAELNAVPAYTFVVDEEVPLQADKCNKLVREVANDHNLDPDIAVLKMDGEHFWETTPPQLACGNDQKTQENLDSNKKPFVTITEISLKTQPCEVPPPSRPPPKLTIKQGSRKDLKSSEKNARQGTANDSSPTFFDVEVDISSSAAASAAAMKYAMQKAEARLKSAKEMMERKKDGLQHRKKLGMKEDFKGKEKWESGTARDVGRVEEERSRIELERKDSDLKGFDGEEKQKGIVVAHVAPDLERKPSLFKSSNNNVNKKQLDECRLTQEPQQEEVIGEWKAEEQFYELVKKDPAGSVLLNPGHKKSELSSIPTPRVDQNGYDGKNAEVLACVSQEKSHEKSEASRKTSELEEDIKRLEVAKETWERAEHDEKRKAAQKIYDQEKQERRRVEAHALEGLEKQRKVLEQEEYEKNLRETCEHEKEAREREDYEKKLREALEREEHEKKLKLDHEREENEKKKKEALLREENERRQREIREREENERRHREAEENERRIYEKKQEEARRREENERIQKEVREREENEKKLRESRERQETERKLKQAAEDNEKRLKELREREESERRLKEALEKEESERRLKEVREREEYERKLKEVLEREEHERRLKEVREREEYERKLKEVLEKEENERRLKEVREREEYERRLKEISEREESERRYRAEREKEESEKKLKDLHEREEIERKLKQAAEENESRQKEVHESEEREKLHKETHACEEVIATKLSQKETREGVEDELRDCNESEMRPEAVFEKIPENTKSNSGDPEQETYNTKLKTSQESREPASSSSDHSDNGDSLKENEVSSQENENERLRAADTSSTSYGDENRNRSVNGVIVEESKSASKEKNLSGRTSKEKEHEKERLRKFEEDRQREKEREKDRMAVERVTREARERAYADARERAERAAVERATAEARQRAMAEARERLEKACAEAREKSLAEKAYSEARLRAERAAVERATAEARERAVEKAMAERAAMEARERVERTVSEKFSATSRDNGLRHSASFSDIRDAQFQNSSSFNGSQRYPNSSNYSGNEVETAQRCKARLERHQRTVERAAKALADKNLRDYQTQREQAERHRLAETLDADVKRWSNGKEGNLRALLSTLQYILGPESHWQSVPLTEVITAAAVKKAYRKATLCVHPDKLQQRGASIQQKYICEKVFDLLKDAWNKFNSEER